MIRSDLPDIVLNAIKALGGSATIPMTAKHIWERHESELKASGNLFYTWQYDMRWAANKLRRQNRLKPANVSPRGIWEVA